MKYKSGSGMKVWLKGNIQGPSTQASKEKACDKRYEHKPASTCATSLACGIQKANIHDISIRNAVSTHKAKRGDM